MLHEIGAVDSELEGDPRKSSKVTKSSKIFTAAYEREDDDEEYYR